MSYNIFHGVGQQADNKLNLSRTAQVIKNQKVDIVGLQVLAHKDSFWMPYPRMALLHDIQACIRSLDHAFRRYAKCTR